MVQRKTTSGIRIILFVFPRTMKHAARIKSIGWGQIETISRQVEEVANILLGLKGPCNAIDS